MKAFIIIVKISIDSMMAE